MYREVKARGAFCLSRRMLHRDRSKTADHVAGIAVASVATFAAIGVATAGVEKSHGPLSPLTVACVGDAARAFGHSEAELWTILSAEGGGAPGARVGECKLHGNGARDCGPFQINSGELPQVARLMGTSVTEATRLVRDDGCFSAHVASMVLRRKKQAGGSDWDGLGRYHSATPGRKEGYQRKLIEHFRRLYPGAGR